MFDYLIPPTSHQFLWRWVFYLLSYHAKRFGEPWKSFFEPDSLIRDLKDIGFAQASDIGPAKINTLFFKNRQDGLKVGHFVHLMTARV